MSKDLTKLLWIIVSADLAKLLSKVACAMLNGWETPSADRPDPLAPGELIPDPLAPGELILEIIELNLNAGIVTVNLEWVCGSVFSLICTTVVGSDWSGLSLSSLWRLEFCWTIILFLPSRH